MPSWFVDFYQITPCSFIFWTEESQAVQSLLAQTFGHSCCPFLGLLWFFILFLTFAAEGPALHMVFKLWVKYGLQNDIVATLQRSRAADHAAWDKKWEELIETAGEREGYSSLCNSGYRSTYSYCNDSNLSWATAWILTDNITQYILKLWWTKAIRSLPLLIYSKV